MNAWKVVNLPFVVIVLVAGWSAQATAQIRPDQDPRIDRQGDPETLGKAIDRVVSMRKGGMSSKEIARWWTDVIDDRLKNPN